ncbi:MAG: hypothetical protein IT314_04180 [Anaerolineales bacterium]|nr:hypothetical protein [Anaerolineales bacterium]
MTEPAPTPEPTPTTQPEAPAEDKPKGVTTDKPSIETVRIRYAFWLGIVGFSLTIILAVVVAVLTQNGFKDAQAVSLIVSPFLTVLGTLVGAFFGLQIGAAGTDQLNQQVQDANARAEDANARAQSFAAAADPNNLQQAVDAFKKITGR